MAADGFEHRLGHTKGASRGVYQHRYGATREYECQERAQRKNKTHRDVSNFQDPPPHRQILIWVPPYNVLHVKVQPIRYIAQRSDNVVRSREISEVIPGARREVILGGCIPDPLNPISCSSCRFL